MTLHDKIAALPEWHDIPGYGGRYQVSDSAEVRRVLKGRMRHMSQWKNASGYWCVALSANGKTRVWRVHQLVLLAFVGPRPDGYEGAHLDGSRTNNAPANLRWVTRKENAEHRRVHGTDPIGEAHPMHKLTEREVMEIRAADPAIRHPVLAKRYGVSISAISRVRRGDNWSHMPCGRDALLAALEGPK